MEKYEKIEKLGEGAHGVVHKYRIKSRKDALLLEQLSGLPIVNREKEKATEADSKASLNNATATDAATKSSLKRKYDAIAKSSTDAEFDPQLDSLVCDSEFFAIKKIRVRDSSLGLSQDALREMMLLHELRHAHILPCYEQFLHRSNIHLVLEYMSHDLETVIRDRIRFPVITLPHLKSYMHMLLSGVNYCHDHFILHRDLKPGNCLFSRANILKLADFGLAKAFGSPRRNMSPQAQTLWYRAPELLYGSSSYSASCDMWSVGCIMGELMKRSPLFQGQHTELNQLQTIFSVVGVPTHDNWPLASYLPNYTEWKLTKPPQALALQFAAFGADAGQLLQSMLELDPLKRITARNALKHRFFHVAPRMTPCDELPKLQPNQ